MGKILTYFKDLDKEVIIEVSRLHDGEIIFRCDDNIKETMPVGYKVTNGGLKSMGEDVLSLFKLLIYISPIVGICISMAVLIKLLLIL